MELNYLMTIVDRRRADELTKLCAEQRLPVILTALGRGTATQGLLDLYGLEATEKAVVVAVANAEKTARLIWEVRSQLYIDIPGNGVMVAVPVKSVGGAKTLAFLSDGADAAATAPRIDPEHELIVAIVNEGHTDEVMDAARAAGARGGTVLHAKGTGVSREEKFHGVSLINERELIFIVAASDTKAAIIRSILSGSGPETPAGAIAFSLPVSHVAGLRLRP